MEIGSSLASEGLEIQLLMETLNEKSSIGLEMQIATESMVCGDSTNSPQKIFRRLKTKPRGLEEEAVVSPGSTSPKEITLEGLVWGGLPEELVDRILAWLPPICLFRLRGVCKRWHSIVNEHGFLKLLSQPFTWPMFSHDSKEWRNMAKCSV